MERLDRKGNQLQQLSVIAMLLTGLLSAGFVLLDTDRPACYQLLWLLPVAFSLDCILIYPLRRFLFTRISFTMISGLYWVRMVATPVFLVLGDYQVVSENTSWQSYLDQAFILEIYESLVVFLLLLALGSYLEQAPRSVVSKAEKIRYTVPFCIMYGSVCAFFLGMILLYPALVRYQFITILGAPPGWSISVLEQRSLDGSGGGPLGVLVTLWCNLIFIMQLTLPAVILTWVLNHRRRWSGVRVVFSAFLLIGATFFIATESRNYSVISALALLLTLMAYSDKKQLRLETAALVLLAFAALFGLWYKAAFSGRLSFENPFLLLSTIITSYFSGPQNIAASIEAAKQMGGSDPLLLLADIKQAVPFLSTLINRICSSTLVSTNTLFNSILYNDPSAAYTDQIIPAIGQGYMIAGPLLAPIFPAFTAMISVLLERGASQSKWLIEKNVCYAGAILMALCQVINNLGIALMYLWYIVLAAIFAYFTHIQERPTFSHEYRQPTA